jgi:elongation factor 3
VEHEISGELVTMTTREFMLAAAKKQGAESDGVTAVLERMGFDAAMQERPVQELSGGWRMRLALAKAMLSECDILCLDEPTNHLDVHAVAWLEGFLSSLTICVVVVSHQPSFLDAVVTDMLFIHEQQLRCFSGSYTQFCQQEPLFNLQQAEVGGAATTEFVFPEPEPLTNVAPTKAILKLTNVNFAYPGGPTVLHDVTAKLMLVSRCAVIGGNGAGKSTLVKLMVGELEAAGKLWRHAQLRIAYVAQHSFFHLEQYLHDTAVNYLQHR